MGSQNETSKNQTVGWGMIYKINVFNDTACQQNETMSHQDPPTLYGVTWNELIDRTAPARKAVRLGIQNRVESLRSSYTGGCVSPQSEGSLRPIRP